MLKRTLCAILSLVMLLCAFPLTVFAEEVTVSGPQQLIGNEPDEAEYFYESENNSSRSNADLLTRDCIYVCGDVGSKGDNYDFFKIKATRSYKIKLIAISGANGTDTTRFKLCSSSGKVLKTAKYEGAEYTNGQYDDLYSLEYTIAPGTYYFRVTDSKYWVSYQFYFDVLEALDAPEASTSVKKSSGKPIVKWDAVSGADYYRVYRATSSSGTYKLVKSTSSTSYTDTNATAGKKYYYKVKAMSNGQYEDSRYSSVVSRVCDCAQPDVWLTHRSTTGKNIVKWEAVSGAKSYKVYCSTSKGGTYKCIGTTTKTQLVHTEGKSGKVYYYKVKAISKVTSAADSAYSVIQSQRVK